LWIDLNAVGWKRIRWGPDSAWYGFVLIVPIETFACVQRRQITRLVESFHISTPTRFRQALLILAQRSVWVPDQSLIQVNLSFLSFEFSQKQPIWLKCS